MSTSNYSSCTSVDLKPHSAMATYDFKGKRIVVTGAGAGIGKAIVQKLASSGANVVALSLLKDELDQLVREVPNVTPIQGDVSNWAGVQKALGSLGPIHGLVNNAGIANTAMFLDIQEDQVDKTFGVNVKGIIAVSQAIAKNMIANKVQGGSIVNISSIAALTALEGATIYCTSKGAVHSLTRNMAVELGKQGIRVNSVNPTVVKTELSRFIWETDAVAAMVNDRTPMGRFATVDEVANATAYLLSDGASMVNGVALTVDGGYIAA